MTARLAKTFLALTTVAALALPAGAQARHGADDPAGHVRHSSVERHHHHKRHHSRSSRTALRHHARHGADDGPNHR
jgi:hypothetical protein